MSKVWKIHLETHTQKLLLIALADNANDEGYCWPSVETLATKCDLSRQGVIDQIESLERLRILEVERQLGKPNHYHLFVEDFLDGYEARLNFEKASIPVNGVDGSSSRPPVNRVDHHQSMPLTAPVNRVDPNHQEPSLEPPTLGSVGGEVFQETWQEWITYRKKLGKVKDWDALFERQSSWLKQFDEATQIEILNQSLRQGWQGLFPPKGNGSSGGLGVSGADKMIWQKEYERILQKMKSVKDSYPEHQTWSLKDRALWTSLKARKAELSKKLGIML